MATKVSGTVTGINYPWLNYGWDFGEPPAGWTGGLNRKAFRAAQQAALAKDLRDLRALGMEVVRWFVLADGLTYGTGDFAPQGDGRFLVLPPGDGAIGSIVTDFSDVLRLCADAGVKLLPSLIDFHWCFPMKKVGEGLVKCGRAAVLQDEIQRRIFLDTVLDPLLEASLTYPNSIYAWEPINEPEWCTSGSPWKFWERESDNKTVSRSDMKAYIRESVARINARGFLSTVGFAHWDTIGEWDAEDLDIGIQQFHYYAQGGAELPAAAAVTSRPCLVGEFASSPGMAWPCETQTLDQRLRKVRELGYAGSLLWSMRATDEATLWNEQQRIIVARCQSFEDTGLA